MNERIQELYNQAALYAFNQRVSDQSVAKDLHSAINEKFAELIAAEEREACAKVCESLEIPDTIEGAHPDYVDGKRMAAMQCAEAIRARGNDA